MHVCMHARMHVRLPGEVDMKEVGDCRQQRACEGRVNRRADGPKEDTRNTTVCPSYVLQKPYDSTEYNPIHKSVTDSH